MPTWEEIFVHGIRNTVYRDLDLDKVADRILLVIGSSPLFLLQKLENAEKISLTMTTGFFRGAKVSISKCGTGPIAVEELIHVLSLTKAKYVVGIGATGGLMAEIGDIVIPTTAARGEGLTRCYYSDKIEANPDSDVLSTLVQSAKGIGAKFHMGKIYTSGTMLHETDGVIKFLKEECYISIDCETSAFFLLCRYKGLRCGMILFVSDEPYRKLTFSSSPKLTRKWIEAQEIAAQIALEGMISPLINKSCDENEHSRS